MAMQDVIICHVCKNLTTVRLFVYLMTAFSPQHSCVPPACPRHEPYVARWH